MLTRRALLRQSAFLSMAPVVPAFLEQTALASTPEADGTILVVVQLDGGNDGINTVVPFGDPEYPRYRRELRIAKSDICKLCEGIGLHPSMRKAANLVEDGRLGIVQGVGYPNPDRSHFQSMSIWQTARVGKNLPDDDGGGWLGRALDADAPAKFMNGPAAVHIGQQSLPRALFARRASASSFADASDLAMSLHIAAGSTNDGEDLASFVERTVTSAYTTASALEAAANRKADASGRYPETELASQLELVARSIKAGASARVYYVIQQGYDTHAVQLPTQDRLLGAFAGAVRAFLDDLAAAMLADRVTLMAFSEFGRRPQENGSLGTDHGTAGPVFLAGPTVKAGLLGTTPRLGDLEGGDLKWSTDFRSLYTALLDRWLKLPSAKILGREFEPSPIFRA